MAQEITPESVAETATVTTEFDPHEIMLLGVFGTESEPEALIRLPNGEVRKIARGTRIGRQTVAAIDATRIALRRGGYARWIEIPGS